MENTSMNNEPFYNANRRVWDARVPRNTVSSLYNLPAFEAGETSLNDIERSEVGDVTGKSLLHLQCHFGLDTLSWARQGARVTGIDLSPAAITLAQALAEKHAPTARFVCCNIYDTRRFLPEQFDVVFTSYGVIVWLPDLDRWAGVIAGSLAPGGFFYMAEFHPYLMIFDDDFQEMRYDYFAAREPIVTTDAGLGMEEYSWNHPISEILTSLLDHGLQIEWFHEFSYSPYDCYPGMIDLGSGRYVFEKYGPKIPYIFSLKAQKRIGR
jgi:SAM-dependent methyltransferase